MTPLVASFYFYKGAALLQQGAFFGLMLAQSTSLDSAVGKGMGIMARIAYLGAFGMVIAASWNVQKGQAESAKWSVMGALIAACASLIVKALFATGEVQINITPS